MSDEEKYLISCTEICYVTKKKLLARHTDAIHNYLRFLKLKFYLNHEWLEMIDYHSNISNNHFKSKCIYYHSCSCHRNICINNMHTNIWFITIHIFFWKIYKHMLYSIINLYTIKSSENLLSLLHIYHKFFHSNCLVNDHIHPLLTFKHTLHPYIICIW